MQTAVTQQHTPPAQTIPHNRSWPLVGDTLNFTQDGHNFMLRLHREHGDIVELSIFGMRIIFMMGPQANEFVLMDREKRFANAGWIPLIGPFFNRGVMLLDFDEHKLHRHIMQGAFTNAALQGYLADMQPLIARDAAQWAPDNAMQLFKRIKLMSLNIGAEVFIGEEPGADADRMNTAFLDCVRAGTGLVRFGLPGTRWHKGLQGRKLLESCFRKQVPLRRAQETGDLFSRLCHAKTDSGESFSDEDVINHVIFVLMAAHDTTTITLSNMMYWLAKYPSWQERLREESRAIGSDTLRWEDLDKLEGATLVMKEALRLCAPVPVLPRRVTKDTEFKGHVLPAGAMIALSPYLTHHMPGVWTKPTEFDPERFSAARAEDRQHPFKWLPFGGGVHKCIGLHFGGMEVKAILHHLLLNFRWSVDDDYVMPLDYTSLPIPKDGLPVRWRKL
jgi:cytochrome P450